VAKEQFVDPQFAQRMPELTVDNPAVDLSQSTERNRGRYWYNQHVVLVVEQHARLESRPVLTGLRDAFSNVAYFLNHEYHESARMKLIASLICRGLCSGGLAADSL
jgi:hypothetical protein